jgi:predicted nucleic acid-binding protein
MPNIVADATPLIHLSRIGRLELLRLLFDDVAIPPDVHEEVVIRGEAEGRPDALVVKEAVGRWILVRELDKAQKGSVETLRRASPLGRGEAACIVLGRSLRVPVILDDGVAVKTARRLGLSTYWTTSIILRAVTRGFLTRKEGRRAIRELVRSGLHVRSDVLLELLETLRD